MAEQTLKEKTAKGLFWGGISNGVQQLLGVVIGIVLLKNLTPDDYGMFGMLAIFTAIASTIQESGFTAALTNRPEFKSEDYNAVFWFNLLIGGLIYVILFFCAPLIADFYRKPQLIILSRALFLSILIASMGIAHNAVLFKKIMVKERAKVEILSTFMAGTIGIYLALNKYGYWALVIQSIVYASSSTLLRFFFSPWRPSFSISFTPIKEMIGFSSKLLFSYLINTLQSQIFSVLLGRYYTASILGYYSQGSKWGGMGSQVINGMVFNVAQPMISSINNNKERQVVVFRKLLRFISFVSCPLLLGLSFISKEFISVINSEFLPAVPILKIYCYIGVISTIQYVYSQACIAFGRSDFYSYVTFIYAIFQIMVSLFVFTFGIYWLALSVLILNLLNLFVWHYYFSKIINFKFFDLIKDVFPYFIISLVTLFFVYIAVFNIKEIYIVLMLKILLSVVIYILLLWLFNSIILKDVYNLIFKRKIN